MASVLDKPVLVLNRNWQAVNIRTCREALSACAADAATAMDFSGGLFIPTRWDDWLKLPIQEGDDVIRTQHLAVRAPRVIVAISYAKVPMKRPKATTAYLMKLYGGIDYWTGKPVSKARASKEHVKPRSRLSDLEKATGGNDFENLVISDRDINSMRGNMTPEEFAAMTGFRPHYTRKVPKALPVSALIHNPGIPEWEHFLEGKRK
jgi:hypothetical protein